MSNKWALITGASAGLGTEFAKLFAENKISVVLVARRKDRLEDLALNLRKLHHEIKTEVIELDLSKSGAIVKLVKSLEDKKINIDYLVNNAGFGSAGVFHELPVARELEMIDLNVRALVELTSLLVPGMVDRGSGRVLNVGSIAGFQPGPYMATYYASKAFVDSFSEAIAEELRGTGVTVTVLAPGPVATEFATVANPTQSILFFKANLATSTEVARTGYDAMMAGEGLTIHGLKSKAMLQGQRFLPRALVRKTAALLNRMT